MATKKTTSKKKPPTDAIALLKQDHEKVRTLLGQLENATGPRRQKLLGQIETELKIHTTIEEEIFYPAVKLALKDDELIPEATVEHATLKALIAEVEGVEPDGEMFDARIKVMSEYVKHHVKEEQNEMFPKAKSTKLDMLALGAKLAERKAQLVSESEVLA